MEGAGSAGKCVRGGAERVGCCGLSLRAKLAVVRGFQQFEEGAPSLGAARTVWVLSGGLSPGFSLG